MNERAEPLHESWAFLLPCTTTLKTTDRYKEYARTRICDVVLQYTNLEWMIVHALITSAPGKTIVLKYL